MVSSGLLRRVALVRTDVSEEPGASFTRHHSSVAIMFTGSSYCDTGHTHRNELSTLVKAMTTKYDDHATAFAK
jgi:hypothetical protein